MLNIYWLEALREHRIGNRKGGRFPGSYTWKQARDQFRNKMKAPEIKKNNTDSIFIQRVQAGEYRGVPGSTVTGSTVESPSSDSIRPALGKVNACFCSYVTWLQQEQRDPHPWGMKDTFSTPFQKLGKSIFSRANNVNLAHAPVLRVTSTASTPALLLSTPRRAWQGSGRTDSVSSDAQAGLGASRPQGKPTVGPPTFRWLGYLFMTNDATTGQTSWIIRKRLQNRSELSNHTSITIREIP